MLRRAYIYARTHDPRGNDKVLVINNQDILLLPQVDLYSNPLSTVCEALEEQTGLGLYPDRRLSPGVFRLPEFTEAVRFPILEGKIYTNDVEISCYSIEVNENRELKEGVCWLPWELLREDERLSDLMRLVISLFYSKSTGWILKRNKEDWIISYDRRSRSVDYTTKVELKEQPVYDQKETLLFNLMRKFGMIN